MCFSFPLSVGVSFCLSASVHRSGRARVWLACETAPRQPASRRDETNQRVGRPASQPASRLGGHVDVETGEQARVLQSENENDTDGRRAPAAGRPTDRTGERAAGTRAADFQFPVARSEAKSESGPFEFCCFRPQAALWLRASERARERESANHSAIWLAGRPRSGRSEQLEASLRAN